MDTLSLTLHADGSSEHELKGASTFPRHWVYRDGKLVEKSGLIDFKEWYRKAFGENTPWGKEDSEPFVTAVETRARAGDLAVDHAERHVLEASHLEVDEELVEQGEQSDELYLLLDGVLAGRGRR